VQPFASEGNVDATLSDKREKWEICLEKKKKTNQIVLLISIHE
jgi:hypothetical protein